MLVANRTSETSEFLVRYLRIRDGIAEPAQVTVSVDAAPAAADAARSAALASFQAWHDRDRRWEYVIDYIEPLPR